MSGKPERARLEQALGYQFKRAGLLEQALTHSSIGNAARPDNQRLEFLGDRVLGLVIADALLREDRDASEGQIAPRFNALVRKETCAEIAENIGVGEALILGRSEAKTGGRRKTALLGDAMEAVIAAIYRDADMATVRAVILRLWGDRIEATEDDARDPKTTLQEWAQARGFKPPKYVILHRDGPDHMPVFTVEARLDNDMTAMAKASAKRQAEQEAAARVLALIAEMEND